MKLASLHELPPGWWAYPHTVSGYRVHYTWGEACRSVFWAGHNEFWMIWTDVGPAALFLWLYWRIAWPVHPLCTLMFAGAVLCRMCSLAYHTFNCVSPAVHQRLIYLDLVGIASNAWGVPWVSLLAFRRLHSAFLGLFFLMYVACVARLAVGMASRSPVGAGHQRMLVALAAVGSLPALFAVADETHPLPVRACLFAGPFCFAAGYVLFYVLRVPECLLPPGSADLQWWNSHVLWHLSSALGQLAFLWGASVC